MGKTVGGAVTTVAGVLVIKGTAGIGTVPGYAMATFGGSTVTEGVTQIFGGGEGENGWNPGRAAAGEIGYAIGGETGQYYATLVYNLTDLAVSLKAAVGSLKAAAGTQKFQLSAKFRFAQGVKIPQWIAKGNKITRVVGKELVSNWAIVFAKHSAKAVLSSREVATNITETARLTPKGQKLMKERRQLESKGIKILYEARKKSRNYNWEKLTKKQQDAIDQAIKGMLDVGEEIKVKNQAINKEVRDVH